MSEVNLLKIFIMYDTVSPMKLTEKVAETIGEVLTEKGFQVNVSNIQNHLGVNLQS